MAKDISNIENIINLDDYDIIISLCVVYHFENMRDIILLLCRKSKELILQTNLGHGGSILERACVENHLSILKDTKGICKVYTDVKKFPIIHWRSCE